MWVNKADNWSIDLKPLERFLTERIIQRCDLDESISNKHKTSNGYSQLEELVSLCTLTMERSRTIRTVKVLIEESKSPLLTQNICNDVIISKYFSDLKYFITNYDQNKLTIDSNQPNLVELTFLIHKLKKFKSQLERGYFRCLSKEFFKVNYAETEKFYRHAARIAELVDILIPYLIFEGYAISSLSEVLKSWVEKRYKATARRIFYFFNFRKRTYDYLIKIDKAVEEEYESIIPLLEEDQQIKITAGNVRELKRTRRELRNLFEDEQSIILYTHSDLDPHNHFRSIYDRLLKRLVQKKERQSLTLFNSFLNSCYWRIPKSRKEYHFVQLSNDPINVNSRGRTLRDTLIKSKDDFAYSFDEKTSIVIPKNEQLSNSLYYYNLALGSKSIENSLSLLWTSLESLLPFRVYYSDIECVQDFVSKSLAIGSIVRDIYAFGKRMNFVNNENGNSFEAIGCNSISNCFCKKGITEWYKWLVEVGNHSEKFELIKNNSELMAYEYQRIGKPLVEGKLSYLKDRIQTSNDSMKFQLQRIYLHRNQIIHSGNLVNEYTNLWSHLEWYAGKLLAYAIIKIEINKSEESLCDLFIEVHSDFDYIMSYLQKNSSKSIKDVSNRVKEILLNHSWQSF